MEGGGEGDPQQNDEQVHGTEARQGQQVQVRFHHVKQQKCFFFSYRIFLRRLRNYLRL